MALYAKEVDRQLEATTEVSTASRRDAEGTALEQDEDGRTERRKKESTKIKADAGKEQLRFKVGTEVWTPVPNGPPRKCGLQIPTKPHSFEIQETAVKTSLCINLLFNFQCLF